MQLQAGHSNRTHSANDTVSTWSSIPSSGFKGHQSVNGGGEGMGGDET